LTGVTIADFIEPSGIAGWTGEIMSHALSIAAKIRHRLLFALSPRYRRIRARLNEIAAD
jgi:hypothetical protein